MLRRLRIAIEMTGRELVRSRVVVLLLIVIPSVFYAVGYLTGSDDTIAFRLGAVAPDLVITARQADQVAVFIGLAATGLLAAFTGLELLQRDAEVHRRLALCGYHASELVAAKLAVLVAVLVLVALYVAAVVPLAFFAPRRFEGVLAGFVAVGWVYGCFGLLVAALVRRQLEGILFVALLTNMDAGWLQNPVWYAQAQNQAVIRALPAHLPSQAAMAAAFTGEPLLAPLVGSLVYGLALLALALTVYAVRMRRR